MWVVNFADIGNTNFHLRKESVKIENDFFGTKQNSEYGEGNFE